MLRPVCVFWLVACVSVAGAPPLMAAAQKRKVPAPVVRNSLDVTCPADLGKGAKSKRAFCDITVGTDPAAGIVMRVPPHTGPSILRFDLHNRFAVAGNSLPFARASALVAVLDGNSGALIERAGVLGELRTPLDLFDRIAGTGPGGYKTVAPGRAEPVKVRLPAAVTSISIVGLRVELTDKDGRAAFATPGRPVAIGSNFRIEYTPAAVGKR